MNPSLTRCRITPLPDDQAAFYVDGEERTRWHFGNGYPRPFFYPIAGPSGATSLTRLGHPGAPNHDHHRSVWFAHEKVVGVNFWSDKTPAKIRQIEWMDYVDGNDEARMAVRLAWLDGHDPQPLLHQTLFVALRPLEDSEWLLELHSVLEPAAELLEFGKTNFGFLAVRVAKSISAHFGDGTITNSMGQLNETRIFGQKASWVDYSGSVEVREGKPTIEGITYFGHPANPGFPHRWHVREDGWMGNSICFDGPQLTHRANPLALRFQLYVHRGPVDPDRARQLELEFHRRPAMQLRRSTAKHRHYELTRMSG